MALVTDPGDLSALRAEMERMAARKYAANSRRAYGSAWRQFVAWCSLHDLSPLPATTETVALYATYLTLRETPLAPETLRQHLKAIGWHHKEERLLVDLSMAREVVRTYKRERAEAGWRPRQVDPVLREDLLKIRETIDFRKPIGVRDWAIIMAGVALMGRRSELECLDIPDLGYEPPHWLKIRICASKTDQAGDQQIVQVKRGQDHTLCPVSALLNWTNWLHMRGIEDGPLFRSLQGMGTKLTIHGEAKHPAALEGRLTGHGIAKVYKKLYDRAGIDKDISGHSGRTGGVTMTYLAGAGLIEIADHGRWKRYSQSLTEYLRGLDARINNPVARIF